MISKPFPHSRVTRVTQFSQGLNLQVLPLRLTNRAVRRVLSEVVGLERRGFDATDFTIDNHHYILSGGVGSTSQGPDLETGNYAQPRNRS
jgi:hypothetical protein